MEGQVPNPESSPLVYESSRVSWATAELIQSTSSWGARSFVYFLTASCLVGLIYSSFAKVAVPVEAPGVIATESAVLPIKSAINLRIAKLMVRNNQAVKKGDVLLVSEESLSEAEYSAIRAHIQELALVLAEDRNEECKTCLPTLERLAARSYTVKGLGEAGASFEAVQGMLRELVTSKRQYSRMDEVTASLRRQIELAQRKLGEIRRRKAEKIMAYQIEQLNGEIVSAQAQIAERTQSLKTGIENTRNRLEVKLAGLLPALEQQLSNHVIVAPMDGTVSQLKVGGSGEYLSAGQAILELVPSHSQFIAQLGVANRDISRIRRGLDVTLKLDALPEREFGVLTGKVEAVPATVDAVDSSKTDSSYRVLVKLDRQSLKKGDVEYTFRSGMTLQGFVITERETLLRLAFRRLFNLFQSGSVGT